MSKKTSACLTLAMLLLACGAVVAQTTSAAPYCMPTFGTTTGAGGISAVTFGSTTNITTTQGNRYTYYNNLPANSAIAGSTFGFNVSAGGNATSGMIFSLYVDWNQDNVFSTQQGTNAEAVFSQSGSGGGGSFFMGGFVSDTALAGNTRARIMWVNGVDPCQSTNSIPYDGEIEDYQINVSGTKPIPRVAPAHNLTGIKATLRGTVHANGPGTATVDFEYGQTTLYTNSITGGSVTANAHTSVTANITGLSPNTIYHYRVKSTNAFGTSYSPDQTFVTNNSNVGVAQTAVAAYSVSPNPGNGLIKLTGLQQGHGYNAEVYDVAGRQVFAGPISETGNLDLQPLVKGIYLLKVVDRKGASPVLPVSRIVLL